MRIHILKTRKLKFDKTINLLSIDVFFKVFYWSTPGKVTILLTLIPFFFHVKTFLPQDCQNENKLFALNLSANLQIIKIFRI